MTGMEIAGLAQLGLGAYSTWQANERAKEAKSEYEKRMAEWRSQDTSNLYANMENPMEDLTINQQQAQFTAQQQAQGFSNTMQALRASAGSSGVAALAQSLAGAQAQAMQQASASIGEQEARNQQLAAGQAARNQLFERQGAEKSRMMEASMIQTELGMSMQQLAAANAQRQQAIAGMIGGAGNFAMARFAGGVGGNTTETIADPQVRSEPKTYEVQTGKVYDATTFESNYDLLNPLKYDQYVRTDVNYLNNWSWNEDE